MSIFTDIYNTIKKNYLALNSTLNPFFEPLYQLEKAENPGLPDIRQGIEKTTEDLAVGVNKTLKNINKAVVEPIKNIGIQAGQVIKIIIYALVIGSIMYFVSIILKRKNA